MGELDLVFVIDETGSMGSYIENVRNNVSMVINSVSSLSLCKSLRYGLIGYKDHSDEYVSKVHVPLTSEFFEMKRGVNQLTAGGGGDYPEAVTDGLYDLVRLRWRPSAAKTVVLIGDAPPHGVGAYGDSHRAGCPCEESWIEQIESCREMGIVIHTVECPGHTMSGIWKRIAQDTFGQALKLSAVSSLPTIITGVAEVDLLKQKVAQDVYNEFKKQEKVLTNLKEEQDRFDHLFEKLSNIKVLELQDTSFQTKTRAFNKEDLNQAILQLKLLQLSSSIGQIFPTTGNNLPVKNGLIVKSSDSTIPLKGVVVNAKIIGSCAEVEIVQTYTNEFEHPVETVYNFPVDDLSCVTGFVAEIDGKKIIAKCMEKQKAQNVYSDAIASGKGAYLLEQKKSNLFTINVANLPPGKSVVIKITYITELEYQDSALQFVLPTTIAPKYRSQKKVAKLIEFDEDILSQTVPYTFQLNLTAEMATDITEMNCLTHKIVSTINGNKGHVTLADRSEMNSDLVLLIRDSQKAESSLVLEEFQSEDGKISYAMMATFVPKFDFSSPDTQQSVILMLDCSSSMIGNVDTLKKATEYFLDDIGNYAKDWNFNVVCWGSHLRFLSPQNILTGEYQPSITHKQEFIDSINANMGGTELLGALKKIVKQSNRPTDIILFTDGATSNEEKLISFIKSNSSLRIYPVGIGYSANRPLIRQIARESGGAHQFMIPGEDASIKVKKQLHGIFYCAKEPGMRWDSLSLFSIVPSRLGAVTNQSRHTFFAIIPKKDFPSTLNIEMVSENDTIAKLVIQNPSPSSTGKVIHAIAARNIIRETEQNTNNKEEQEKQILPLALQFSIASKFTSFVAVEDRTEAITETPQLVNIPSALPKLATESASRDRDLSLRGIESDIVEVNAMFKDLSKMISEQCEELDHIESRIDASSSLVRESHRHLIYAESAPRRSGFGCPISVRMLFFCICILFFLIAIIVLAIVLPLTLK